MEPSLLQLWPAGTDFSSVTEQEILDTINDVKVNSVTGVPMEARRFLGEVVEEEGRVVAARVSRPPLPHPPGHIHAVVRQGQHLRHQGG